MRQMSFPFVAFSSWDYYVFTVEAKNKPPAVPCIKLHQLLLSLSFLVIVKHRFSVKKLCVL